MSLSSLFKRKARTILTCLGVVVGTVSIVVMISLGIGMKKTMLDDASSYGSLTEITVNQPESYTNDGKERSDRELEALYLSDERIEEFLAMDHVTAVYPELSVSILIKTGPYIGYTDLTGMTYEAMKNNMQLSSGNIPDDNDPFSIVYGNTILSNFSNEKTGSYVYWDTGKVPDVDLMHDAVFIIFDQNAYFSAKSGSKDENGNAVRMPKKYVIPTAGMIKGEISDYGAYGFGAYCNINALEDMLKRIYRNKTIPGQPSRKNGKPFKKMFYSSLKVEVDNMENVSAVQTQIQEMGYRTYAEAEWIESEMKTMNVIQAVLGGIGAVSLLVAAIGITNTMMMSIYERTKEIGIMKVIGCRIRDIQSLFLIEAAYIGFIGGTMGVIFSYLLSVLINHVVTNSEIGAEMGFQAGSALSVIPVWLGPVAVVFAILIAMVAGFFPSLRAMKLSPLAAIRAE